MSDDRAFTGWVSALAVRHTSYLANVARNEGLGATDALDAVQDALQTFLLLPQSRSLIDDPEDTAKLMTVLVRNAARNAQRRHHRSREHVELGDIDIDIDIAEAAPTVEEMIDRAETHVRLLGCVARLNDIQRCVVRLRMLEEVSAPEVAHALQLTPQYVAVLLHRAKKELERCMLE